MRCGAPDCEWRTTKMSASIADQVVDGVEQRLALGRRRRADVEVDHVGGQALGGDLERRARARRVLEEQVEHRLAAQQRHLLHLALGDRRRTARRCRGCWRMTSARQALEREQVRELAVRVELRIAHRASAPACRLRRASAACRRPSRDSTIDRSRATASRAPTVRRLDRQLAAAAIDEHGELDARGTAEVEQLVDRRAHAAARCRARRRPARSSRRRRRTAARCACAPAFEPAASRSRRGRTRRR